MVFFFLHCIAFASAIDKMAIYVHMHIHRDTYTSYTHIERFVYKVYILVRRVYLGLYIIYANNQQSNVEEKKIVRLSVRLFQSRHVLRLLSRNQQSILVKANTIRWMCSMVIRLPYYKLSLSNHRIAHSTNMMAVRIIPKSDILFPLIRVALPFSFRSWIADAKVLVLVADLIHFTGNVFVHLLTTVGRNLIYH